MVLARRKLFGLVLASVLPIRAQNKKPKSKPKSKARSRLTIPRGFVATEDSQIVQNLRADLDGLTRLSNDDDLNDFIQAKLLVPIPIVKGLSIKDLDSKWWYVRPWTSRFIIDLAEAYNKQFPRGTLFITSAVRTVKRQTELISGGNDNAASTTGLRASSHLTGATIDITKKGLTINEIYWIRRQLRSLHNVSMYVVEESGSQVCFHTMVYKGYTKPENW